MYKATENARKAKRYQMSNDENNKKKAWLFRARLYQKKSKTKLVTFKYKKSLQDQNQGRY